MTQTLERPPVEEQPAVPPHNHFFVQPEEHQHLAISGLAFSGMILAIMGIVIGVGVLLVFANRDTADEAAIANVVDARLAGNPAVIEQPFVGEVIPALTPKAQLQPAPAGEVNVAYAPNTPPAVTRTDQRIVEVHFEIVENVITIDPEKGVETLSWGYRLIGDDNVFVGAPGPMIRARVGDLLRFTLTNPATSQHPHNVDFHAVTGQGGGAADTLVAPGETATIEARLLYPGIFMYHCAAGDVPVHISRGMYGGILVDPEEPLPPADHEFYIVQSEWYTDSTEAGLVDLDRAALTNEEPTMVVFNGAKGALTGDNALQMRVGERARFYFVNAGLNLDSNFHPIGSHWDAVWPEGATLNEPIRGSQTTLVPAGGGVVVDMVGRVPSNIILVDHALTRTFDKGALGVVQVTGEADPEIFYAGVEEITPGASQPAIVGEDVRILANSWQPQDDNAADEFADRESPGDYSVNVLRISVGDTVTWTNDDETLHTVTAVDGSFDSGFMRQGDTWSYTFNAAGEYEYLCTPHPWMRAKVIVEE